MWVFAYGSLVFRPGFSPVRTERVAVRGFVRRFYQGSADHRGVPGKLGRVLTLVPLAGGVCEGLAYEIAPHEIDRTLAYLDHREQGGYRQLRVSIALPGGGEPSAEALTYVADALNPLWLGHAPEPEMAAQMRAAHGPSGSNRDYVLELAAELERRGIRDEHVLAIAALLR